jgi:hypothetical protein
MKHSLLAGFLAAFCLGSLSLSAQTDSAFLRNVYHEALERGEAFENLRYLCKNIGARLSGSAEAEMAVVWSKQLMESYGFDRVYLQEIQVPHWVRGTKEAAWLISSAGQILKVNVLALGGSIATNGLMEGEIIAFENLEALKNADSAKVAGKVVYLAQAFDQKLLNTFAAYGACGSMRWGGAIEAAKKGAIAVVIRSLGSDVDDHPHTGSMQYDDAVTKIPAAALSTRDSELLNGLLKTGTVTIRLEMDCRWLEPVKSYNVIAELTGRRKNDIITFGGHLDSWDVGEGAHDDGAGVMHSLEALRILKKLGYRPEHTLRCVFFMNEENGNFGGKGYADYAKANNENHVAAIESDRGGFLPLGFDVSGTDAQVAFVWQLAEPLRKNYQLHQFQKGYGGVDIGPLKQYYPDMLQLGAVINSQEYFKYHHTEADVFETVDKRELALGSAALAAMVYLLDKNLVVEELKK